jgi:hypothetical protein
MESPQAPGGDIVDVVKETRNAAKGEPVDGFVLDLSLVGLLIDLGWADGIVPDPADGGNAAASFLKTLLKHIDDGPARDALEQMLKNPDAYGKIVEAIQELSKNSDLLTRIDNPEIFVKLIESGSEGIELLAKNGELGIKLINDHGADMAEFLIRHSDETGTAAQNALGVIEAGEKLAKAAPGPDEAVELADQIAKLSTHGTGSRVVLGEWMPNGGGYIGEAVEKGGIYFETPNAYWKAIGENKELAWLANERFLREQLESGIDIVVNGDVAYLYKTAQGRTIWEEIDFLKKYAKEYGYEQIGNVWKITQ